MPLIGMEADSRFASNDATVRVMCNKETNTDWCQRVATGNSDQSQFKAPAVAATSSQSRTDGSHNSTSIRRWQTFSPAGVAEDSYVCKLNRSDSDSKVRRRQHCKFERQSADRKNVRIKKSSSLQQSHPRVQPRPKVRTSLDLELDYQAYKMRQACLNEEVVKLKEFKRLMEEAIAQGGDAPERLARDPQLQQYLHYIDQLLPRSDVGPGAGDTEVNIIAQQRISKMRKDIQRRIQRAQDDEMAFRKKMSFFVRPQACLLPSASDAAATDIQPCRTVYQTAHAADRTGYR